MNYSEARALMQRARYPENGKPLENNTRLYQRGEDYAVKLHQTDVVTIHADGTYTLKTGGWETMRTREVIFGYAPVTWHNIVSIMDDGERTWWIRTRPNVKDPEPIRHAREIEHPTWVRSPGPEPVKGSFGCLAGSRVARSFWKRDSYWLDFHQGHERVRDSDIPTFEKGNAPNRARDVTAYLKSNEKYLGFYRFTTVVTDYTETYERASTICPHCAAFNTHHYAWQRANAEWKRFVEMMDRFGSQRAWLEAAREDLRRVKAENEAWRAWDLRNRIPLNGVRVNSDGHPLAKDAQAYFKAQRAIARAERRAEREREERERYERQVERFKQRVAKAQAKREGEFIAAARRVTTTINVIRTGVQT